MEKEEYRHDKLGPALVAAMAEIPAIPKNAQAYGYKYATLDDILNVVKPVLARHNLVLLQPLTGDGLETIIMHESGQCLRSVASLPHMTGNKKMNEAQAVGATITYFRRYALASILGISNDEDTDGVIGQKATTKPVQSNESQGSFSGFKKAAEVVEPKRKTPEPVIEAPIVEEDKPKWVEVAESTLETPIEEKEKAPQVINWDEQARLEGNLCTKKQASFIYSLAQRALGQDFELEELVNWTEDHNVSEADYVGLGPDEFCGNLQKRDATKVINEMKRLAGIETK
ncbi:MAG: hypothetical protein CMP53_05480 [Flavobacteriales bacterium]|nr:hypothetical protein [Flavobacteriales bacterium]